jgi:hypothetical protein
MSAADPVYLLDSNVFIQAHRRYYAFDLCPGFWECLIHHHSQTQQIISIDRVRDEITGHDEIVHWVKGTPEGLFVSTRTANVAGSFAEMMEWVNGSQQFREEAKAEFAQVADGWLAAYAKVHGCIVDTHEVYDADSKKKVPLPNVCRQFGVEFLDTFMMLRQLEARFNWTA